MCIKRYKALKVNAQNVVAFTQNATTFALKRLFHLRMSGTLRRKLAREDRSD